MTDILTPTLGESVSEATVARWTKKPGEAVKKNEVLVELETDKVSLEVSAPSDGVLGEISAPEGESVTPGQKLGSVSENGAAEPAPTGKGAKAPAAPVAAKPAAAAAPAGEAQPAPAAPAAGKGLADVTVPTMGESVAEGTMGAWSKKVGDKVMRDEVLVEIETDKVAVEISSPAEGVLTEILAENGASVTPGQVIARVSGEGVISQPSGAGEQTPANQPPAAQKGANTSATPSGPPAGLPLAPSVQRIAAENNLDTSGLAGSGKDGRLTKGDALQAVQTQVAAQPVAAPQVAAPAPVVAPSAPRAPQAGEERVRMTRLRQTIAKRLKDAQNTAAMLTTFNEVDMSTVMALRAQYKDVFEKRHGVKLGFMSFFVKACIAALKEVPDVNAEIDGADLVYKNHYDIGVAVGTDRGLVVPVVRDADHLSLAGIEKAIGALGKKARDGQLSMEDMSGGTFTITNGGIYGSLMSTPILNAPQSGILGMHNIVNRPIAVKDQVVIRPMMYLALSYDHRVVDGKGAVTFLVAVKNAIEDPQRLLLDL
jgi:2-oxoglutarate dehydrogenase E2 component (dihydrolipoamide succinyltransferase)